MKYLWDPSDDKVTPHIYTRCSPFKKGFDENRNFFTGGTAVVIEAGLLNGRQVLVSLGKMEKDMKKAGAQSIGLTLIYIPACLLSLSHQKNIEQSLPGLDRRNNLILYCVENCIQSGITNDALFSRFLAGISVFSA